MLRARGPIIVPVHSVVERGINCCCCRCCACMQLDILKTGPGAIKLAEVVIGFFALNFCYVNASSMGIFFKAFIATASWCLMTSSLLLLCYIFSQKSLSLLKSSFFETLFNGVAGFSYLTSCSYLAWAMDVILNPIDFVLSFLISGMSFAYFLGTVLGLLYLYDSYKSYRYFKGYR